MFSERVKLEIEDEISGFERTTLNRLMSSFDNIEAEASDKRQFYLDRRSNQFDPDRDDEGCIAEDGYFKEVNHVLIETALKQEFTNSIAVWLFHLFVRQKKRTFGSDKECTIKPKASGINKLINIGQDRLSSSRLARARILIVCNPWHNAEDGSIDKQDW
jgi:hypothetical protein